MSQRRSATREACLVFEIRRAISYTTTRRCFSKRLSPIYRAPFTFWLTIIFHTFLERDALTGVRFPLVAKPKKDAREHHLLAKRKCFFSLPFSDSARKPAG